MAEQADQAEFARMFRVMGDQIAGLSTTMGAQGVARVIKPFEGDSKCFKDWIKMIEKYSMLVGMANDSIKLVAYQSSKGPVSDFLKRHMDANPAHTWAEVKAELTVRFAEVVDPQHALLLLRKVRQKQGEAIQVYAERLIGLGEDAFDAQNRDTQLIGYFIDGLYHDYMKMKVMRENPQTLQQAVTSATNEQNLRKRFNLRTGHDMGGNHSNLSEAQPMEVDHYRPQPRCFNCQKRGHLAKNCRNKQKQVNAANIAHERRAPRQVNVPRADLICWHCGKSVILLGTVQKGIKMLKMVAGRIG